MEFDYVIVGGGTAGCVLAARLSEDKSISVAMLESGGPDKSVLIHAPAGVVAMLPTRINNYAYETTPQAGLNGRKGYQPRGKTLGGSSSINAMLYVRGHRWDYDHWAELGNPGWSYDEVLPYFRRSEHNEQFHDAYHGQGGPLNVTYPRHASPINQMFLDAAALNGLRLNPDYNGAEQEGAFLYQVTHKDGERCSAAKGYLTPNLSRPNLHVMTHAVAARILLEGQRAVGVEFHHDGELKQVRVRREVLLTSGTFGSPQLMLLSGIGPAEELRSLGIPIAGDLPGVGKNLQDHIDYVQGWRTRSDTQTFGVSLRGVAKFTGAMFEWRNKRSGMVTSPSRRPGHSSARNRTWPRPTCNWCSCSPSSKTMRASSTSGMASPAMWTCCVPIAVAKSDWPAAMPATHRSSTRASWTTNATCNCWSRAHRHRCESSSRLRSMPCAARCSIRFVPTTRSGWPPTFAIAPTPSTTRWGPARWARPRIRRPWWMPSCASTGFTGCG